LYSAEIGGFSGILADSVAKLDSVSARALEKCLKTKRFERYTIT
jgi:hypothetical protein